MPGRSGAMFCCDLFKALRHDWYTGQRLENELHIMWSTWKRWSRELDANGFLVRRTRTIMMSNDKRRRVVEYALAAEWGGQAVGVTSYRKGVGHEANPGPTSHHSPQA